MFDLVNAIEDYPQFLEWCSGAAVQSRTATEVIASIDIGLAGISQSFTTKNTLSPPAGEQGGRIGVELVSGPFKRLEGEWVFEPVVTGGCDVRLDLEFEIAFSPLKFVFSSLFGEIARSQMNAFVARAAEVYADV